MNAKIFKRINIAISIIGIIFGILLFLFAHYYIRGNFMDSLGLSVGGFILPIIEFVMHL